MGNLGTLIVILYGVGALVLSLVIGGLLSFLFTNFERNKLASQQKPDLVALNRAAGTRQDGLFALGKRLGKGGAVLSGVLFAVGILAAGLLTYIFARNGNLLKGGGQLVILPEQASTTAAATDSFFYILLAISVVVFLLVQGLLVYSLIAFRRRRGETGDGASFSHNTTIEIIWTAIPTVIVTIFAFLSFTILSSIRNQPAGEDPIVVTVTGQQYAWVFNYPQYGNFATAELQLPKDRPVRFEVTAVDVLHSFWIPAFRLKQDAVPGRTVIVYMVPSKLGTYPIMCAELCGEGHGNMSVKSDGSPAYQVKIVEATAFEEWASQSATPTGDGMFAKGGCAGCHTLTAIGASGVVGPNLDNIGNLAAERQAGVSAEDYLRQSIQDPQAFVAPDCPNGPCTSPSVMTAGLADKFTPEEFDILVQFLLEQKQ